MYRDRSPYGARQFVVSLLAYVVSGILLGVLVLHPASLAIQLRHDGRTVRGVELLSLAFSSGHVEMSLFFALLGAAVGAGYGIWSYRYHRVLYQLHRLSVTDSGTGVYNRRAFFDRLDEELRRADRYKHPVSLVLLDIDHFKRINDRFGHQEGDRVLRRLGEVLQEFVRSTDLVARYGGEEFALLMPETDRGETLVLGERLRSQIANSIEAGVPAEAVTVSLGTSTRLGHGTADALVGLADAALYEAKRTGRNRICGGGEV